MKEHPMIACCSHELFALSTPAALLGVVFFAGLILVPAWRHAGRRG
jgi:hypothetical protein